MGGQLSRFQGREGNLPRHGIHWETHTRWDITMALRVLPWTDNRQTFNRLIELLQPLEVQLVSTTPPANLWEFVQRSRVDVVVQYDFADRASQEGAQLAERMRHLAHRPSVLFLTDGQGEPEAVNLLSPACRSEPGNFACIPDDSHCQLQVRQLFDEVRRQRRFDLPQLALRTPLQDLWHRLTDRPEHDPMRQFVAMARRLVHANTSLLLLGETGVGKEWFARAIHAEGDRRDGPFVAVNCAGIPETLLDSELFGHESGAFTGAMQKRRGAFEMAEGGTILLDEIGEMPPHLQCKLLRVLQDRSVKRLGSETSRPIDVRIIAATNRNLAAELRAGRFREDLYYRVGVVTLTVPSLHDHWHDIPDLLIYYLTHMCQRLNKDIHGFSDAAWRTLLSYSWPGNVRQLINTVERAVLICDGGWIDTCHLPAEIATSPHGHSDIQRTVMSDPMLNDASRSLRPMKEARAEMLAVWEKDYLVRCLAESHGRIQEAAMLADLNPRSLRELMRRHGLRKEQFRRKNRL
jgi:DNA-binding NtrC family response regulator